MPVVYLLILAPILIFVIAFLYETYLSFSRLKNLKAGKENYVSATWEVTHTLLVFGVVMLVMLFTSSLEGLASAIFTSTFIAAGALTVRAICYTHIFYVRQTKTINWVDWVFAFSHIVAALFLVITVAKALWYLYENNPSANEQFLPYFLPGLAAVLLICAIPILMLYKTKN